MEWGQIAQAVLSLIFVIGLLLLTLWAVKYCELKGLKSRFVKQLKQNQRLEVVERHKIDARNTLILLRRDNVETLVLLGSSQNLILEQNIPHTEGQPSNV